MAKRAVIELIKSYIDLLNREGFSIEKTFLYGSYLDNTQSEDSDIDILLVSKDIDLSDDFIIGKIWALTKKINTKIEPFVISSERFNSDNISPLVQLVKQKGLEIA